jgi:CheY-like chemotaxis protein
MNQWELQRLRVLVVGSQNSFDHVLAANIRRWGHEAVVLPSAKLLMKMEFEAEGDILLYDLDTLFRASSSLQEKDRYIFASRLSSGSPAFLHAGSAVAEPYPVSAISALPGIRRRFTIAMSSHSISRMAIEQIGAVALLYKPFEMGQLQRYFSVLQRLLWEQTEHSRPSPAASSKYTRVLVADDDVEVALAIKRCLLDVSRYDVAMAHDGLEALEQCLDWHPRCVVTDLIMPFMNGYQVMRCLAGTLCTMPGFVVMSALNQLEMPLDRSYLEGRSVEYIDKPFEVDHLLTAVERACSV